MKVFCAVLICFAGFGLVWSEVVPPETSVSLNDDTTPEVQQPTPPTQVSPQKTDGPSSLLSRIDDMQETVKSFVEHLEKGCEPSVTDEPPKEPEDLNPETEEPFTDEPPNEEEDLNQEIKEPDETIPTDSNLHLNTVEEETQLVSPDHNVEKRDAEDCNCPPGPPGNTGFPGFPGLPGFVGQKGDRGRPSAPGANMGVRGRGRDHPYHRRPGAGGPIRGYSRGRGRDRTGNVDGLKGEKGEPGIPGLDGLPGPKGDAPIMGIGFVGNVRHYVNSLTKKNCTCKV